MNREKILDLAATRTDEPPGSQKFLSFYNRARHQLQEKLTDNERQKYMGMAKDWTEGHLPQEIKQW